MDTQSSHQNRLAGEKSPYLLQHKDNPVDWYPWSSEALEKAKKEDKLIFLSVGYSTCHWCHVMAHESFESKDIANIMNQNFVNIKVDREERPDIDKIYMTYVQAISGGGGWPMSVWLTPELKPIVGGTYFPPRDSYGRRGFASILLQITQLWREKRDELISQGSRTISLLQESIEESQKAPEGIKVDKDIIYKCYQQIERSFDPDLGGFSHAPKFPRPVIFNLLFQVVAREGKDSPMGKKALEMILFTLTKMGNGGVFDHLGGGFHRYSVTADWHVPHFEKMLYDQGQLVNSYLDAFRLSKDPLFERKARDVMEYVMGTITSEEGGIYSAEDADSLLEHGKPQHAEGAFYVWTMKEVEENLNEAQAKVFKYHFAVREHGNAPPEGDPHSEFENKNILIQRQSLEDTAKMLRMEVEEVSKLIEESKKILFKVREKRPRPHLDDKIITAWNGLMISAYARAYQILSEEKYLNAGKRAASFIREKLYDVNQEILIRNYRHGPSNIRGFADDYSFLIAGLLDLYEASTEIQWLQWAIKLQNKQNELFWDAQNGGYFAVEGGDPTLLLRMKEDYDGAEPCNNSVSALNLLRLAQMTDNKTWREYAEKTFTAFSNILTNSPIVLPQMCVALDFYLSSPMQVILAADPQSEDFGVMFREVFSHHIPNKVLLYADQKEGQSFLSQYLAIIKDMKMVNNKPTAYVCKNYTCNLPVNSPQDLAKVLQEK